jgi:hypothetical protein
MRSVFLFILLLIFNPSDAFTAKQAPKKREPTRPAFTVEVEKHAQQQPQQPLPSPATIAFGFSPALTEVYQSYYEDEEEAVVGYTTAIVSMALAVALGFGVGYAT